MQQQNSRGFSASSEMHCAHCSHAVFVRQQRVLAAACIHLRQVVRSLVVETAAESDGDDWHALFDDQDGTMFQVSGSIPLRLNAGGFVEL
jgi:hypothetical protein